MAALDRVLDALSRLVILLAGTALVFLVAITGWMVFGRYVLNDTPTWVERSATLIVVSITLLVAAVGVRERFHLSVLGFREALPLRLERAAAILCDVIVALFGVAMAVWSWELVETSWVVRIPLLGFSQAWTYLPLVASGVLMAVFATEQVVRALLGSRVEPTATVLQE